MSDEIRHLEVTMNHGNFKMTNFVQVHDSYNEPKPMFQNPYD